MLRRLRRTSALIPLALAICVSGIVFATSSENGDVRFAIVGDRTGEAQPGVYEQIWNEIAAEHPDFVINVGDTIQGEDDAEIKSEWSAVKRMLLPFANYRFFYVPGNHDVWDDASARAYVRETNHPLRYSFDFGSVHISVLDNSRTDDLPASELDWLEHDLSTHRNEPAKFVFSHRPSWILYTVLQNPNFPLQQLAKRFGVQYVIAGHVHQILHFDLQTINYLSLPSSGGHLRDSKRYEDGWFFAHTFVSVHNGKANLKIEETGHPYGDGRTSKPEDWGAAGLLRGRDASSRGK